MPTCCAVVGDGRTPCSRTVIRTGELCWQHQRLGRSCANPYQVRAPVVVVSKKPPPPRATTAQEKQMVDLIPYLTIKPNQVSAVPFVVKNRSSLTMTEISKTNKCGQVHLCTWPKNLKYRGKNTWTLDPERLYAELYNHASIHGGSGQNQLVNTKPSTWCDILKNNVWPTDAWLDKQYAFIDTHKNEVVGDIFEEYKHNDIKYVPATFRDYIGSYIAASSSVYQYDKEHPNPNPGIKRVAALMKQSAPVDRSFYVYRGIALYVDSPKKESVQMFDAILNGTAATMPLYDFIPASTTIDSQIGLTFMQGASIDFEENKRAGLLVRILIPEGSIGVLPIGRFAYADKDATAYEYESSANLEQEIWLPPDAKIKFIPSSMRRSTVIYNFGRGTGDKLNPIDDGCDTYEVLTVEAYYES